MEMIVNISLIAIAIYLLCGLVFTIAFIVKGLAVVDEGAQGSSIGFKIIIIPGVIVLWPFLLIRWLKQARKH
jgi:regulator of protease activity HflC (stomatin/prohibitin superfamily)